MKRVNWLAQGSFVAVCCLASAGALQAAQYTEIQNDAFDGVDDASYIGGIFEWSTSDTTGFNLLTLYEDNVPLGGLTSNVTLTISGLEFQSFGTLPGPARAYLTGGTMSLTFDYNDGGPTTSHQLSGPVSEGSIEITSAGPGFSTLTGIVNFDTNAGVENLPSSNNWPAAGESTAVALTFAVGADLSAYQTAEGWESDMPNAEDVTYDTVFSIVPEEQPIPEPSALILLAAGSIAFLRRRHA